MVDPAEALRRVRDGGEPPAGPAWSRWWADVLDAALRPAWQRGVPTGRAVLLAVGGYGRRDLCPRSDVDLLLLHERSPQAELEHLVRAVVHPLWDAGLQVGYAVRSAREAVTAARDDLDAATGLLDARVVAGDHLLAGEVHDRALRHHRTRPRAFLERLTAADELRRARAGDAAEVLEPDLKNGAGGLRDVQSLRWAAAVLVGTVGLDPLVGAGYLGAPDRARLARAYDHLLRVRVALHQEEGRSNVLRQELQEAVAHRLGYQDGAGDRDTRVHRLLTDLYLASRTIDHVHRRAWTLIRADAVAGRRRHRTAQRVVDGFELLDGVLRVGEGQDVTAAEVPQRLLRTLTTTGAVLDRRTATVLRGAATGGAHRWGWTPRGRRLLLDSLWAGRPALTALAELDDVGAWTALLPEWAPLRARAQRNPFHRFSLDRHAWHAAVELAELVRHETWATRALERVGDRDALLLGVLLHDVGKAVGEPHDETGVPVAEAIATRLGCPAATVARVGTYVRHHLLLPDTAQRRDLSDPVLATVLAERIGDRETLAGLHLLAAADGRATGPTAWSPWKAQLVDALVSKVAAVMEQQHPDEVADGAVVTADEALALAPELGVDVDTVRGHLAMLPSRYAAAVSARAIVRHAGMAAAGELQAAEARTRVAPGAEDRFDELDVVALDTPGLFAKVAGVLALHGGSVVAAHAFTRTDGVAVDTFTVVRPPDATGSWWAAVEGDLDEAVAGRLALSARVRMKAARDRRHRGAPAVPTSVTCADDASGSATVVEVRAADRLGLLYRIAAALAELELDVVAARIQTLGHEVVDVFYVRDATGAPLDDHHGREVELAVTSAVVDDVGDLPTVP